MADGEFFPRWVQRRYRPAFKLLKADARPQLVGAALATALKEPWQALRDVSHQQFIDAMRGGRFEVLDLLGRQGTGDGDYREALASTCVALASGQPEFVALRTDFDLGIAISEGALRRMAHAQFLDRINSRMVDIKGADATAQFGRLQKQSLAHAGLERIAHALVEGRIARPVTKIDGGRLGTEALLGESTDRKLRSVGA
jgi:hypothetical protein